MLKRFGLVIHWLAFVLGGFYALAGTANLIRVGAIVGIEDAVTGLVFLFFGCFAAGWVTNFILAGHKSQLPWVANKEANNGR